MGGREPRLLEVYAGRERRTTVLIAGVASAEGRCPAAAGRDLERCLDVLGQAAELSGGRVVKRASDEVMALFSTPDAAAAAAARMQLYAQTLPPAPYGVGSAFHTGTLGQRGREVYGETIELAAALAFHAKRGQVLTSEDTVSIMSPPLQRAVQPLRGVQITVTGTRVPLGELVWRNTPGAVPSLAALKLRASVLRLIYRHESMLRRREGDALAIGRDPDCDLCVEERVASRRHCTIVRANGEFVVRDHSTNGTFITIEGEDETRIRAEEFVLRGKGWLTLGTPLDVADELVQFKCE